MTRGGFICAADRAVLTVRSVEIATVTQRIYSREARGSPARGNHTPASRAPAETDVGHPTSPMAMAGYILTACHSDVAFPRSP
ncbi:hypothetical protein BHE74_00014764 [Ensete ventricosum]|nr:hypothetical protein BHE74_00014764 [Ensete ventricosum]